MIWLRHAELDGLDGTLSTAVTELLRLMCSDTSTCVDGCNKKFSAKRFLLRSSRLPSIDSVAHLRCKLSFMVVACRVGKFALLWV